MSTPLFGILAVLMVVGALGVILQRNPVRSALALVATLFLQAVVFVFLDAHVLAVLQVIVYAGAIMVLFLFVIMLLNLGAEPRETGRWMLRGLGSLAGAALALQLIHLARGTTTAPGDGMAGALTPGYGSTEVLGERLFTQFLLPFELTSVLLLVAIVGAVVLAKRHLT